MQQNVTILAADDEDQQINSREQPKRQWFSSRIGEAERIKITTYIEEAERFKAYDYSEVFVFNRALREVLEYLTTTDQRYSWLFELNPLFPNTRYHTIRDHVAKVMTYTYEDEERSPESLTKSDATFGHESTMNKTKDTSAQAVEIQQDDAIKVKEFNIEVQDVSDI